MKIDAGFEGRLSDVGAWTQKVISSGVFEGIWVSDTTNDPFLLAGEFTRATPEVSIGTNIAVAFARSPYVLAQTAYNLAELSKGRFILGLGTQVRAHINKRFCMDWPSQPVAALKEYIALLRHLFDCFNSGRRPSFKGDFYKCTLNSPVFTPDKHKFQTPPIGFAAVGPALTQAAGELADLVFLHPFTHLKYLNETSLPALRQGQENRDSKLPKLQIVGSAFCLASDDPDYQTKKQAALGRLAFYASTPNYEKVVSSLGLQDLHGKLHDLSRRGEWAKMAESLPPQFIDACIVEAPKAELKEQLHQRFSAIYDRVVVEPSAFL